MNGAIPDNDKPAVFAVPVTPLDKITKQVNSTAIADKDQQSFSYFNVDLLHSKYTQSLKDYNRDWQNPKNDDFEWSSEQINTLLEFYSLYPQLWDTKHERYMNKDVRKQLISQLSEKVGAPEQAVNVKFQRLRVHYSRELRKEETSGHELHPYQSKWKYYNKMLFLRSTLKCRQKIRQGNSEQFEVAAPSISIPVITNVTTGSSDSGHSSPDSYNVSPTVNIVSPTVNIVSPSTSIVATDSKAPSPRTPENKENMSPSSKISPLSPSLISTPFSSISPSLVPPLLANTHLFHPSALPTPPASLLNSFASLEQLLSPGMLGPMLLNKKEPVPNINTLLAPSGTLVTPTPQVPLTPNVVCSVPSYWNSPHVLTSSRTEVHDELDYPRLYQAKRQKIKHEADRTKLRMGKSVQERIRGEFHTEVTDCDYFSMHVSESLRKMDIIVREECKRAIQNTIYQYIVKSCQRQPYYNTAGNVRFRKT